MTKQIIKCAHCGNDFSAFARTDRTYPKYCKRACYTAGHDWKVDQSKRVNTGKGIRRKRGAEAPQTTCTLNRQAFDVETEESAYWIGMLITDGCVTYAKTGAAQIVLQLQHGDKGHIEKYRKFLGSSHKITYCKATEKNPYDSDRLCVSSDEIADRLLHYGIGPRKSYTAKIIGLENNRHFWRGVIDGDGSIGLYKAKESNCPKIGLVGSKYLCEQWREYALKIVPSLYAEVKPRINIFRIEFNGNAAGDLVKHLYNNSTVALNRKQEIAARIFEHIEPENIENRKANSGWYATGSTHPMLGKQSGSIIQCATCEEDFYVYLSRGTVTYCSWKCYKNGHDWHADRLIRDNKEIAANA